MSSLTYGVVLQGTLGEFTRYDAKYELLSRLIGRPSVAGVVVAVPSLDYDENAKKQIESYGASVFVGDDYNVALRVLAAHRSAGFERQEMVVRICSSWNLIDMDLVDRMVSDAFVTPCHYLFVPKDFDYTAVADIASPEALENIATMADTAPEVARARFNPWSYLEAFAENYDTRVFDAVPMYSADIIEERLGKTRKIYDENEFFGRDYSGSRYEGIADDISEEDRVLDLATGSGHGAARLAQKAAMAVGVDYLQEYIDAARQNYPENECLRFMQGGAQNFVYEGGNWFSVAVSLHTIEHVPDERGMLKTLNKNLHPGGRLILEVPLLMRRPWGRPTNPYHLREYSVEHIRDIVSEAGFSIEKVVGGCRGIYSENLDIMRGEYRIYADKKA